jgi:ribosomal protein L7/L12
LERHVEDFMSETLEDVVNDGVMFVKSLTRHYGADKAMEVWEAMNVALGTEVKGRVFFRMIEGSSASEVKFRIGNIRANGSVISAIKLVREYTGYSLRDSKIAVDQSDFSTSTVIIIDYRKRKDFTRKLRDLGGKVE